MFNKLSPCCKVLRLGMTETSLPKNELGHEKTCLQDFRPGRHKLGCTATEDGKMLEILDLERRGIVVIT